MKIPTLLFFYLVACPAWGAGIPAQVDPSPALIERVGDEYAGLVPELQSIYCAAARFERSKPLDFSAPMSPEDAKQEANLQDGRIKADVGGKIAESPVHFQLLWPSDVKTDGSLTTVTFFGNAPPIRGRAALRLTFAKDCSLFAVRREVFTPDGTHRSTAAVTRGDSAPKTTTDVPDPAPLNVIYAPCEASMSADSFQEILGFHEDVSKVIVAVYDAGVDYNDPKLAYRLLRDAAGNLVARDSFTGTNLAYLNPDPASENAGDPRHAQQVSRIVADGNPDALIMPIVDDSPSSRFAAIDQSVLNDIDFAARHGARVVNMSLEIKSLTALGEDAADGGSNPLAAALRKAIEDHPNIAFVVAAGNDGQDIGSKPVFPAAWTYPNLVTVASVDAGNKLSYFTNYGAAHVQLAAKGEYGPDPDDPKINVRGTSFAAPVVSNAVSRVLKANPKLSAAQAIQIVEQTADASPALAGKVMYGLVNIDKAVAAAEESAAPAANP